MPISPELRVILADAFDQAEPGATLVVPMAARKNVNVRTHLDRIIAKAGHEPWPRLLQNLRASCETDWVERYPAHAVAKWLGHSPKVAAEHYLMSREHHFEDVVNGCVPEANRSREGQGSPPECDAKCASIATRNATLQASASGSREPHEKPEPVATTRVTAGSSGMTPVLKTGLMGSTGLEQPAFYARNPAVAISCDAKCDAISADRIELLARAVVLVAGMKIPDVAREAVLARVTAELANASEQHPQTSASAGESTGG